MKENSRDPFERLRRSNGMLTLSLLVLFGLASIASVSAQDEAPIDVKTLTKAEHKALLAQKRLLKKCESGFGAKTTGLFVVGTSQTEKFAFGEKPAATPGAFIIEETRWEFHVIDNRTAAAELVIDYLADQQPPRRARFFKFFRRFDGDEVDQAEAYKLFLQVNPLYAATSR